MPTTPKLKNARFSTTSRKWWHYSARPRKRSSRKPRTLVCASTNKVSNHTPPPTTLAYRKRKRRLQLARPRESANTVVLLENPGNWTSDIVPVPYSHTLEASSEAYMGGNKGATNKKAGFLRFVRSMLQWDPAARKTAKELLAEDPWLNGRVFNVN